MNAYQPGNDDGASTGEHFDLFDLTVHLGPDAIPWLSAASRAGSVHGVPRRTLPPLADLLDRVYDYTDAVQFAEPDPDPKLSQILGDLVFGDPMVLQLFQATRGVAADRNRQLLFRILASPHLAVLPWELLPDPAAVHSGHGSHYLATSPDTHLARMARGRTYPVRTALLEAPLNLLIVLSSPTPQDESEEWLAFDIFEVKRGLLAELAPLERAGMLHIDVEDRPTLDNLRRRIGAQRRGYHLFHYVGHALPDCLILEDRAGRREDLASSRFVEILRLCPDLRLAVFAGCQTARPASEPSSLDPRTAVGWRDLLSLADYCVQEACPTVIGMQAVLPFSTERVFTRFFYQALASGYSTAEALRLARGAIQSDERVGDDLLDWSVPALFVGSSEPSALVPRSPAAPAPQVRMRSDLKLGLRQTNERFFARELPLRQAVHVMAGLAPERVLVVTGAVGAGKTSMVDRALEELGDSVTHVLYVHFERLSPEVVKACRILEEGRIPDLTELSGLAPENAIERLCRLSTELLRHGRGAVRERDSAWSVDEWWERLIEDLVQHRFVLAIDDIGLLDSAQRGLFAKLVGRWLVEHFDAGGHRKARKKRETVPKQRLLQDLQQLLSELQESEEQVEGVQQSVQGRLASVHRQLVQYLDGLPNRFLGDSLEVLRDFLQDLVAKLSYKEAQLALENTWGDVRLEASAVDPRNVITALNALEAVRKSLGAALRVLADRRSAARVVITAVDKLQHFLDLPDDLVFEIRLAQLTWPEHWRWIRRNLPGLVSYGEVYLSRLWSRLGAQLDRWEELERRVLHARGKTENLQALATQFAPRPQARLAGRGVPLARRGERTLRIAVAGPHLAGPNALAEAITRLAIEHGIGGRVVLDANEAGALAALIDEPSPFVGGVSAHSSDILEWLQRVLAKQPDIILLDYGYSGRPKEILKIIRSRSISADRALLRSTHYRSLLIAAGGNTVGSAQVTIPSAYPEILGVGPLDDDGYLRPYAEWHPGLVKPDLFMADNLAATPLASALKPDFLAQKVSTSIWGSSYSALHAVATAALVWSIRPELSPRGVRTLLLEASNPIIRTKSARALTMGDAVALARRRVVERTLRGGTASLQTLGAITGLEVRVLSATLNSLIERDRVVRLASGRLERFQLL